MDYPTLEKLFYKDTSSQRFDNHQEQLRLRLEAESTFRTGIMLEHGELFCAVPRELSLASEQVLRRGKEGLRPLEGSADSCPGRIHS